MRYRILKNEEGEFIVQSRSFVFSRWHARGQGGSDHQPLNWRADEFKSLEEASKCLTDCMEHDRKLARQNCWSIVLKV